MTVEWTEKRDWDAWRNGPPDSYVLQTQFRVGRWMNWSGSHSWLCNQPAYAWIERGSFGQYPLRACESKLQSPTVPPSAMVLEPSAGCSGSFYDLQKINLVFRCFASSSFCAIIIEHTKTYLRERTIALLPARCRTSSSDTRTSTSTGQRRAENSPRQIGDEGSWSRRNSFVAKCAII